jgi:molecular chaperone HtpG
MATGTLKIHSENILPIIKKWLYSDKDIFARELVSNSCDAIHKVKILRENGQAEANDEEFRIDVDIDKEGRLLKFSDTGIGMDAEEVEKYIAQIAFSGAEEFLSKYKSQDEKEQIIGHFGLGFFSAYMVAGKVQVNTLSYKPDAKPVLWTCEGSSEYQLEEGTRTQRGTEITLFVDKENDEYLEESRISQILHHYCDFLPFPIYLNGKQINKKDPLWLKPAMECTEQEYLDFYSRLYPMDEPPLFWVHLNVDYPFHVKGILYFPKIRPGFDFKKNQIKLYCNRVFVSDHCQELIPDYLIMLRGAIDSSDIPLNVSRSYLQMDRTVRQLGAHISKKVSEKIANHYKNEPEKFIQAWPDIEMVLKLGSLQDEKFYERVKEALIWKNSLGEWTTIDGYLERNREKTKDKIFYTIDEKHPSHFLEMYKERGIEVLYTNSLIDTAMINFLENKHAPAKFQRIDGGIDEAILDASKEKVVLDADGRTEAAHLEQFVRNRLGLQNLQVEAKSLASDSLPCFVLIDENSRRMRDYLSLHQPEMRDDQMLAPKLTFVVNTNSKLMQKIQALDSSDPELAQDMLLQVYELALLSQKEIDPRTLNAFIARSNKVLEKLALRA